MNATQRVRATTMRLALRSVGRLSDGVRLCLDEGLTAGKTVDYVYRNQPSGRLLVGKWFDRMYLANPDWRAVRARRANLETLLEEAVRDVRAQGRHVALLDIASGPGLYVLSVIAKAGADGIEALCCDFDERWAAEGNAEARARGLSGVVRYERGDAFDRDAMLARRPRPNVVVASGFYDWIVDDEMVRRSIGIVFEALEPGGRFVLTHQVSHPDLEFVRAVFTDHTHKPLEMKMRPSDQVCGWLAEAGFEIGRTLVDDGGYYAATSARKP